MDQDDARSVYAAYALQGLLSNFYFGTCDLADLKVEAVACKAFEIADAMVAVREAGLQSKPR